MTQEYCLSSSQLTINAEHEAGLIEAVDQTMGDYADSVDTDFNPEHDGKLNFTFYFGGEAGDSFPGRIQRLVDAIGPYLIGSGRVQLREETMSDERDQVFYAGATPEIIEQARVDDFLEQAKSALANIVPITGNSSCPVVNAARIALDSVNTALKNNRSAPEDATLTIKTIWGDLQLPAGAEMISTFEGHTLLAAVRREDGDADVLGSINLQLLTHRASNASEITQTIARFVSMHPAANVFTIAENLPDVLEITHEVDAGPDIDQPA